MLIVVDNTAPITLLEGIPLTNWVIDKMGGIPIVPIAVVREPSIKVTDIIQARGEDVLTSELPIAVHVT